MNSQSIELGLLRSAESNLRKLVCLPSDDLLQQGVLLVLLMKLGLRLNQGVMHPTIDVELLGMRFEELAHLRVLPLCPGHCAVHSLQCLNSMRAVGVGAIAAS